ASGEQGRTSSGEGEALEMRTSSSCQSNVKVLTVQLKQSDVFQSSFSKHLPKHITWEQWHMLGSLPMSRVRRECQDGVNRRGQNLKKVVKSESSLAIG
ncbi:Hypothetical predicted protein, partial [Podarcis lilfordi]